MPVSYDPNDGTTAGASFLPLSLNPANQTRCDARSAYFEPYAARSNLWIATNQYVTRILFEGGSGNPNTTIPTPSDASTGQGSSFSRPDGLFSNITQNAVTTKHRRSWLGHHILKAVMSRIFLQKREPMNTPVTSVGGLIRANGVEVSICLCLQFRVWSSSMANFSLVRFSSICSQKECHSTQRGNHSCRSNPYSSNSQAFWTWPLKRARNASDTRLSGSSRCWYEPARPCTSRSLL